METANQRPVWVAFVILAVVHPVCVRKIPVVPEKTSCDFINHMATLKCRNLNMTVLTFTNSHERIEVMDVYTSKISMLSRETFRPRRFTKLSRLHLSTVGLESLDPHTFNGLLYLKEVDLSNNVIQNLHVDTFRTNRRLWYLNLRNNPLAPVSHGISFLNARSLKYLDISLCRLRALPVNSLSNITELVHLSLAGNFLTIVDRSMFLPLHQLRILDLSENPWNCECMLQPFRDWYVYEFPSLGDSVFCDQPRCVEGKSWSQAQDFCSDATIITLARVRREVSKEDQLWASLPYPGCKGPEPTSEFPWLPVVAAAIVVAIVIIIAIIVYRTCKRKRVTRSFWVRDRDTAPLTTDNFIHHRQNSIVPFGIVDDVATFQRNACDLPTPYPTDVQVVKGVIQDSGIAKGAELRHNQTPQGNFLQRTPIYEILYSSDNQQNHTRKEQVNTECEKQRCTY